MAHNCPSYGCDRRLVNDNILMCRPHWYELPLGDRKKVYESFDKNGPGMAHMQQIQPIIDAQTVRLKAK